MKIEADKQWPMPSNVTDVRSFLGLSSYYRRFIQNFSETVAPFHCLTAKTTEKFKWAAECDQAFMVLKEKFVSVPVLAFPCFCSRLWCHCLWTESSHFTVARRRWEGMRMQLSAQGLWASKQHNQEDDASHSVCWQAFLPLPVRNTVHCWDWPQCVEVPSELQRARRSGSQRLEILAQYN